MTAKWVPTLAGLSLILLPFLAWQHPVRAAEPEKWTAGAWYVKLPSKGYKDLPTLMSEREVAGGQTTLGNIQFVCARKQYYVLLVSPFFKYELSQPGRVAIGESEYSTTFRDLHRTRGAPRLDWDADILFSELPKTMLEKLVDGSAFRVDARDMSWIVESKSISTSVRAFTTYCETGKRLPGGDFRN